MHKQKLVHILDFLSQPFPCLVATADASMSPELTCAVLGLVPVMLIINNMIWVGTSTYNTSMLMRPQNW